MINNNVNLQNTFTITKQKLNNFVTLINLTQKKRSNYDRFNVLFDVFIVIM